jgi:DNA (cytosine-5)-methyltransferase 1
MPLSFDEKSIEQVFEINGNKVFQRLTVNGQVYEAVVENITDDLVPLKAFFVSKLSRRAEYKAEEGRRLRYVDLFCGGGGLSLGVHESLRLLGYRPKCVVAADLDKHALELVQSHFKPHLCLNTFIEHLVHYQIDYTGKFDDFVVAPEVMDDALRSYRGKVDLLVGGPPCQGHSNLNNHTRGSDQRNLLYFTIPAVAIALDIPNIVIENVPTISRAKERVVEITRKLLEARGYHVEEIILKADRYGVAQTRKRHFLVASKERGFDLHATAASLETEPLTFQDINIGMPELDFQHEIFAINGRLNADNLKRINWLHDNDKYNLDKAERPDCHKDGHTYPSVYGRIIADEPMQTITTGFASPGRGRYVHPYERRTLTNREAARGQCFPDWYWSTDSAISLERIRYQKIIGDAVPSNMVLPLIVSLYA